MKLYNTLTGQKEEFIPLEEGKVKMYVCGPTVYNHMHLGNVRPQVVFDTLRRYLLYKGYDVRYVSNFTDVDDKIIKAAIEEKTDIKTITERTIDSVKADLTALSVYDHPIEHPTCTGHMTQIVDFIDDLMEKGYAYEREGNVYFRVKKAKDYGKLSKKNIEDLEAGARVEVNEDKEDPMDFLLWKKKKAGEPAWKSPWSEGRPGWHIECSAMARELLGDTIDIHGGGEDLKFPHHENEIAQSEALTGKPLAKIWMHNGMINIENTKMSKSLGNFFYANEFMEKESPEVLRFFLVNAHYRKPVNFTEEAIVSVKAALRRLHGAKEKLQGLEKTAPNTALESEEKLHRQLMDIKERFIAHMDDDLNTADAVTDWFDLAKFIQKNLHEESSKALIEKTEALFQTFVDVLGVVKEKKKEGDISPEILAKIEAREEARKNRDFATADRLRDELLDAGIQLKDTKDGVQWEKL